MVVPFLFKSFDCGTLMAICYNISNYSFQDVTLARLDTTKVFLRFPTALASWQETNKPCVKRLYSKQI